MFGAVYRDAMVLFPSASGCFQEACGEEGIVDGIEGPESIGTRVFDRRSAMIDPVEHLCRCDRLSQRSGRVIDDQAHGQQTPESAVKLVEQIISQEAQ